MWGFLPFTKVHKSCNYSSGLLRKQEIFLEGDCGFNIYKLKVDMNEVTTVGQKYVLMNHVLGPPTKQGLEWDHVINNLIITYPEAISARDPGFSGKWYLKNTILGSRSAQCY